MDEFLCQICKRPIEVIVRFFSQDPFIDGRTYDEICFTCASVPKQSEYIKETDEWIIFDGLRADKLCTPEDMMEDGWEREEAVHAIKCVKRLLKNPKTIIVPEDGRHVLEVIFSEVEIK